MIVIITLAIFIPLVFWALDVVAKLLGSIPIDDIGADLCLFGTSFGFTSLLSSAILAQWKDSPVSEESVDQLVATTVFLLLISIIAYLFSLILITPSDRPNHPQWIISMKSKSLRITLGIGFVLLSVETVIYVILLTQVGGGV